MSNTVHVDKQKRGKMSFFRQHRWRGERSSKQSEPPIVVAETNDVSQSDVITGEPINATQGIDLSDNPNIQEKLECSIQAIDLFEDLSNNVTFVKPDALRMVMGNITKILERIKVPSFLLVPYSSANYSWCLV